LEKEVVLNSDYRIAVSNQLVNYWKEKFEYRSDKHAVIPCTLNKIYEEAIISNESIANVRESMGIKNDDIVFIYSGSIAGWQSFDLLYSFIKPVLNLGSKFKIIFLSDLDGNIQKLKNEFESQVFCKKVSQNEVPQYLIASDYGLLIREETITNRVASPVKFAEYMACGLKVVISDNLGDYSKLIDEDSMLGCRIKSGLLDFPKINEVEKTKIRNKGLEIFSKNNYKEKYSILIS
jgi:glycosyltransferase involved in cell wall biosynthesis